MAKKITSFPKISIDNILNEYDALREQEKLIKARKDELSAEIKKYADMNGVEDSIGNVYCENEDYLFGKQCRKSIKFNEEKAIQFFQNNNFDDCIKTVEVIDENAVEERVARGDIDYSDLEAITNTKVTFAVEVKKKEKVVEEVGEVKVAKTRKSPLKRK